RREVSGELAPCCVVSGLASYGAGSAPSDTGHFFFSSAVQLVMTFRGRVLVSGAALPMKRWPSLGSTSKIVHTRPVRNGDRNNGRTPSTLMVSADTRIEATIIFPSSATK